jgi:adenine-specific DNA-methyltransferase
MSAYRAAGFRIVGHLLFPKRYASRIGFVLYQHEAAHLLAKGVPHRPAEPISDVIGWRYTGNKLHPTQKPLEVLQALIASFSQPGDFVIAPFAGSGSSQLAAKTLGR